MGYCYFCGKLIHIGDEKNVNVESGNSSFVSFGSSLTPQFGYVTHFSKRLVCKKCYWESTVKTIFVYLILIGIPIAIMLFDISGTNKSKETDAKKNISASQYTEYVILKDNIPVYKEPEQGSQIIGKLQKGQIIKSIYETNNHIKIILNEISSETGFIKKKDAKRK